MLVNITYPDRKTDLQIKNIVGTAFSFIERIKMKGVGCAKLQIKEAAPEIAKLISANSDTAYCNIELRKKGIVVGFNSTGRIYAWCIPYYHLNIYYNSGLLTVFGSNSFIKAQAPFNGTIDKKFIRKILKLKAEISGDPLPY